MAILKELAESRLSVLIGGAGTGKTTLLALLCKSPKIQSGGILLLAPTGKARTRMTQAMSQQSVRFDAKTVARFLIRNERLDRATMSYYLSDSDAKDVPDTVHKARGSEFGEVILIVSEPSNMLTDKYYEDKKNREARRHMTSLGKYHDVDSYQRLLDVMQTL
jgi:ABC-type cobalamin/Fe3+-siderophores transport system ATPase subunit